MASSAERWSNHFGLVDQLCSNRDFFPMTTRYTPKNILITGACGFIGSHVCKTLVIKADPCEFLLRWFTLTDSKCNDTRSKNTLNTTLSTWIFWILAPRPTIWQISRDIQIIHSLRVISAIWTWYSFKNPQWKYFYTCIFPYFSRKGFQSLAISDWQLHLQFLFYFRFLISWSIMPSIQ